MQKVAITDIVKTNNYIFVNKVDPTLIYEAKTAKNKLGTIVIHQVYKKLKDGHYAFMAEATISAATQFEGKAITDFEIYQS